MFDIGTVTTYDRYFKFDASLGSRIKQTLSVADSSFYMNIIVKSSVVCCLYDKSVYFVDFVLIIGKGLDIICAYFGNNVMQR